MNESCRNSCPRFIDLSDNTQVNIHDDVNGDMSRSLIEFEYTVCNGPVSVEVVSRNGLAKSLSSIKKVTVQLCTRNG